MLREKQMLEQTRASKIRNANLLILFMKTPYCGDCVRSLELVKGMRRTFIGQKATSVFADMHSETALAIAMSFFVRKNPLHVFLAFALIAIMLSNGEVFLCLHLQPRCLSLT